MVFQAKMVYIILVNFWKVIHLSLSWMGRYRELVGALVQHTNITMQVAGVKDHVAEDIWLTPNEWQIMEYLIEHRDDDACMNHISDTLDLPQSSFSKTIKLLAAHGLVEKYHKENNQKNVLLKPTQKALDMYYEKKDTVKDDLFANFFRELDGMDEQALLQFTQALKNLNKVLRQDSQRRLERWKEQRKTK